MSLYLGENLIAGNMAPTVTSAVRNLGEIVCSTVPVVDAGLHPLDGAVISGSGIYSEFVSYIAGLYNSGEYSDLFTLEGSWQQAVSDYGVCGKFVYFPVNNAVRLPKYGDQVYTTDIQQDVASVIGNGMAIGLTNGTDNAGFYGNTSYTYAYALKEQYGQPVDATSKTGTLLGGNLGLTTDASKSGMIVQLSDITTPLEGYYYIVVATTTKTDIQVDIDEIATDLNGKVNITDLQEVQCIVETYVNGTSWYRIWSDGWCEQGGDCTLGTFSYTFLKEYTSKPNVQLTFSSTYAGYALVNCVGFYSIPTTTGFTVTSQFTATYYLGASWYACGYIEV